MRTVIATAEGLDIASQLGVIQVANVISPLEVLQVCNREEISFVLVGAYGLAAWFEDPRATQDVDLIVASKHVKKAVRKLSKAFPQLNPEDCEVVIRLRNRETEKVAIDVMKPSQPLMKAVFKNCQLIRYEGQDCRIPTLEMALALKFGPMVSVARDDLKKLQDAFDFGTMVRHNPIINLEKLAELGDLVYPGGSKEILELVDSVRTGKKLRL